MIMGLDPGVTTGFAVLTSEGSLVAQGMIPLSHLREAITRLVDAFHPVVIVVERLPAFKPDAAQVQVISQLQEALGFRTIEQVGPGEWKPMKADLINPLRGSHGSDAVYLTSFWLRNKGVPMD